MSGGPGWIRTINLPIQSRALFWLSYRATIRQPELHRSLADTSGVRRSQRFGGIEMVGQIGAAPSISPIRTARIAVFLVPDEVVEPRGIAPRSTQCHCVVLLLDDGPEMERAPGLAPGKSGFASRRLDDFGIARVLRDGETDGCCPRSTIFTGSNAGYYITASI